MNIADASPRANVRPSFVLLRTRAWAIALLATWIPAGVTQASFDRVETVLAECATMQEPRSLLRIDGCAGHNEFSSFFESRPTLAITSIHLAKAAGDLTASLPRLIPPATPPTLDPAALAPPSLALPSEEPKVQLAPTMIVGAASMYDPTDPDDEDAGTTETASGETYDPEGWTAAIQIGLRGRFGGVRYRMKYELAYALVEVGDKRAIVRINDVGPLKPGRVIDLNLRAMRYFDPTLKVGVIPVVRVTVLEGRHWALGPVDDTDGDAIPIAQASLR
ncbi:MAG: septal ring lytic transglycosylase RlpA family protein [Pseudolabrys sp.]